MACRSASGAYEKSYSYDLSDEDDLTDFNIEQQASIIEDWWRISRNPPLAPLKNTGKDTAVTTYGRFVDQLLAHPLDAIEVTEAKSTAFGG